jgi:hypothetical protein
LKNHRQKQLSWQTSWNYIASSICRCNSCHNLVYLRRSQATKSFPRRSDKWVLYSSVHFGMKLETFRSLALPLHLGNFSLSLVNWNNLPAHTVQDFGRMESTLLSLSSLQVYLLYYKEQENWYQLSPRLGSPYPCTSQKAHCTTDLIMASVMEDNLSTI